MAFKIGSNTLVFVPTSDSSSRGSALVSNGQGNSFWGFMGSTATSGIVDNAQWRYRSVYTHGYLAGGYKGYNPWSSLNKTWHATDTTMYCGEQLGRTASYTNGIFSDYNAYVVAHGTSSYSSATAVIASYGLHNGTVRMFSGDGFSSSGVSYGYVGNNPLGEGLSYGTAGYGSHVGGMAMDVTRSDPATANYIKGYSGYITGGGTAASNKMHYPTETMYTGANSGNSGIGDGASGETRGWFNFSSDYRYITWSSDTWTAGGWGGWTKDYQCKIHSTKWGHHYVGTGDNVTIGKARFSDSTGATLATFNKVRVYGEDNNETGQDWGYILGHYDGQQNNHTIKQAYSSDSEVTLGAGAMPKGHYGQSSGCCSSAAATITSTSIGV